MRHTSRLKSITWYAVVTLLVTFAVLVSVVRLTIGSVSEYRDHLEEVAGRYLGQPVLIKDMDARLVGIKPTVLLDEVSLLEKDTREQLAHFRQIAISLNPLSSLRQMQPIIDLSVHGANIVVGLGEDGGIRVEGVSVSQQARNEGSGGELGAWFLSQSRLALLDSKLVWRDFETNEESVFSGVNLELQNQPDRHRLSGHVKLPETVGKTLRVSLDINGNLLGRKDWKGELYIKAEQVHPAPWLEPFDYKGLRLEQGQVDVELWSSWEGGLLRGIEGEFNLADLAVSDDNDEQHLKRLGGQLRYTASEEGWELKLGRLRIQPDEDPVEPLALSLSHNDEATVLQATALPLTLVRHYGPYFPQLKKTQRDWLLHASPGGLLRDIHLVFGKEKVQAAVDLESLELSAWKRYPGAKGVSGHLSVDWPQAELVIDSEKMALDLPRLFRAPLPVERANGVVQLQKEGQNWRVSTTAMSLTTPDISTEVAFDGWLSPGEAPLISLSARVENGDVSSVPKYLPAHIMSEGSLDWLDRAFVRGKVSSGTVLIHGKLDSFPFYDRSGRFEVVLDTKDVNLHYRDDWPDLSAVAGIVHFDGGGMAIHARRARVFDARMNNTSVAIDDFRRPVLKVGGVADSSVNDALAFLRASPLSQSTGKALEQMKGEGRARIDLDLAIPLTNAVAKRSPLSVDGLVGLDGASLQVVEGVKLEELKGELRFTEQLFSAKDMTAKLYGKPATINVFTRQEDGGELRTVVAAQGRARSEALQQVFDKPILSRIKGETDWKAQLNIVRGEKSYIDLNINSTLKGMTVDLPAPAAKTQKRAQPFTLTWQLGGEGLHTHHLKYGDVVSAVWQYESEAFHLRRAGLVFGGKGKPVLPEQAMIRVEGRLEQFSPKAWTALRDELGRKEGGASVELLPIELAMEHLQLVIETEEQPEQAGEVPTDNGELHTADVPPMTVDVKAFSFGDLDLGHLSLKVRPQGKTVFFDALSLKAKDFSLKGDGYWDEGGNSRYKLAMEAGNFGRMMKGLGFSSIISGGKTRASGNVFWPGPPSAFSLQTLGGEVHTSIEEGVIEEVEPGAGKLLGLLSLQALPRRLFLDFSDLSGKGLQFDKIEGDLRFADGSAYTQNLHLKSLPANVLVTGRTGLVQRDFDQLIAVVPNVSDTVSVAGALAWGPQAAAVLLVLQKLFQSDIDAATMIRYELTGSWDNPEMTKLEPLVQPVPEPGVQPAQGADVQPDSESGVPPARVPDVQPDPGVQPAQGPDVQPDPEPVVQPAQGAEIEPDPEPPE